VNGGRGGSAYLTDPSVGFMGENSIVGAGAAHAVGAALRGQFDGTGRRAVAVMGDGALNQGAVHEALNFAAFRRLPVAFVVENNGFSEMTPIADMVGETELWRRAAGYGLPGLRVDGNDTGALAAEVRRWRSSDPTGPVLIEAMTQRLVGHYVGDPETYRSRAEVDALDAVEPIGRLHRELLAAGAEPSGLDGLAGRVAERIEAAAAWAAEQPVARGETAREHVHA